MSKVAISLRCVARRFYHRKDRKYAKISPEYQELELTTNPVQPRYLTLKKI
jgi:hypothetical protein